MKISSLGARWNANLGGKVMSGSGPVSFLTAIPSAYPKARATGTATAFPTWQYLHKKHQYLS